MQCHVEFVVYMVEAALSKDMANDLIDVLDTDKKLHVGRTGACDVLWVLVGELAGLNILGVMASASKWSDAVDGALVVDEKGAADVCRQLLVLSHTARDSSTV